MQAMARKMSRQFQQLMAEDESFTSTGILAGFMALMMLSIPVTIVLFNG